LGLDGILKDVFVEHHGDLFEVEFWQQVQERIRAGKIIDIFPYEKGKRLSKVKGEG
jgi:isocitrate dehydrogenase kinase/phosphatase